MGDMFMRDLIVRFPTSEELTRARLRSLNMKMRSELALSNGGWRKYLISVPNEWNTEQVAQKLGCPTENIEEMEGYKKVG